MQKTLILVAFGVATFAVVNGVWAFFDPASSHDRVAEFEPFNNHYLHDAGSFQLGLGAALIFALVWRSDALSVALAANAVAVFFHFVSHVQDRNEGGQEIQPWAVGTLAALLLAGVLWRLVSGRAVREPESGRGGSIVAKSEQGS